MTRIPFVLHYATTHFDFRLAELLALAELEGVELEQADIDAWQALPQETAFFVIHLKSRDEAERLTRRSVLLKFVFELWADGVSYDEVHSRLKARIAADPALLEPFMEKSFRFFIHGHGRNISMEEQREKVNSFAYTALRGPIKMKDPEVTLMLLEEYTTLNRGQAADRLKRVYFGLHIGVGNRVARTKFDLKKRAYLGTTSMDAELSLVMSNMAHVQTGSLVLDPFVGTGSMLVTSAHFGAYVSGCDIDGRQIRGGHMGTPWKHTAGKDLRDNFQQYQCESKLIATPVCDISHHPWRAAGFFDAILTDPPYGVRAGAKKIGKPENYRPNPKQRPADTPRYPATVPYELDQVVADLIDFAAVMLTVGGHLSFWMPVIEDGYQPSHIRPNPCMQFKYISEQRFGTWSRFLVTMRKTCEYDGSSKTTLEADETTNTVNFRELKFVYAPERRRQALEQGVENDKIGS